jgi:hypothetical protein
MSMLVKMEMGVSRERERDKQTERKRERERERERKGLGTTQSESLVMRPLGTIGRTDECPQDKEEDTPHTQCRHKIHVTLNPLSVCYSIKGWGG